MDDGIDPQLSEAEQSALEAWDPMLPPSDFTTRVMDELQRPGRNERFDPRRLQWGTPGRRVAIAALVVAAVSVVMAGAAFVGSRHLDSLAKWRERPTAEPGEADLTDRTRKPRQAAAGADPPAPIPGNLADKVEAYLGDYGRLYGPAFQFHGSVLVARDGEVVYQASFGHVDMETQEPHDCTTRMPVGALTIPITATALFQLEAQGRVRLDAPVSTYLPELPARVGAILLRDLLAHRSGLADSAASGLLEAPEDASRLDEVVEWIGLLEPAELPGRDFAPVNVNYILVSAVIERVSGMKFGEYLRRHVFEPAGMTRTTYAPSEPGQVDARGYVFDEDEYLEQAPWIPLSFVAGAGGIVSTPRDLFRWDHALFAGLLLDKAAVERMLADDSEVGYAYGWVRGRLEGRVWAGHPGGISGFNGHFMHFLTDGTFVVALANTDVIDCREVAAAVAEIVYGLDPTPHHEYEAIEVEPEVLDRYVGVYVLQEEERKRLEFVFLPRDLQRIEAVTIVRRGNRLQMVNPDSLTEKWMYAAGEGLFFFKDSVGTLALFDSATEGQSVTRLRLRNPEIEILLQAKH